MAENSCAIYSWAREEEQKEKEDEKQQQDLRPEEARQGRERVNAVKLGF